MKNTRTKLFLRSSGGRDRTPIRGAPGWLPSRGFRWSGSPSTQPTTGENIMALLRTVTLGCKVNQYETQYVRQALLGIGYREAAPGEVAQLCIVNTCTVTQEGDAKSRQVIRRLARQNPGARIIVMGCYATRCPEEVRRLPGVAEVITDKRELPDLLGRFGVVDLPTGISHFGQRHRAYVKVQDGCLLRCTFCIIPQVRPQLVSRPPEDICQEVQRLAAAGYREIVLTGIHLGHYGVDRCRGLPRRQWVRLPELVEQLLELPGEFRLRLSSIEATEVSQRLLELMAQAPDRICPHLHICVQSGSDRVLRRMRRRWGARRLRDRCLLAREMLPHPGLTTDVIVGFPGETEEDFQATCELLEEVGFWKLHVFPFSPRPGTPAAQMPDQVPPPVRQQRVRQLLQLERELRRRYFESLVGCRLQVLCESRDDPPPEGGTAPLRGTACRYVPVVLPGEYPLRELVEVEIDHAAEDHLRGRACRPVACPG